MGLLIISHLYLECIAGPDAFADYVSQLSNAELPLGSAGVLFQ